jgi:hypothetical protein
VLCRAFVEKNPPADLDAFAERFAGTALAPLAQSLLILRAGARSAAIDGLIERGTLNGFPPKENAYLFADHAARWFDRLLARKRIAAARAFADALPSRLAEDDRFRLRIGRLLVAEGAVAAGANIIVRLRARSVWRTVRERAAAMAKRIGRAR